jgi:RNA polymerase sigma-70 factor (ECF subfamily)
MNDDATAIFERHRGHLLGLAYRMLGEMAAAEDVVQEAWLRWRRADLADIRSERAWLSAATMRLALDALRSRRARRETYVGPWLPEPISPDDMRALAADAPAANIELASDLSLALLHVLERLSPEERAAFILHDAFDCDYEEIAAILDKTEPACRKLVSRARANVKTGRPRHAVSGEQHRALVAKFAQAAGGGDAGQLGEIFAPDIVFYSDGGGRVPAALNPIYGADKVSRLIMGLSRKLFERPLPEFRPTDINGEPGLIIAIAGRIDTALTIDSDGPQIVTIYAVRNPDKLARLAAEFSAPKNNVTKFEGV